MALNVRPNTPLSLTIFSYRFLATLDIHRGAKPTAGLLTYYWRCSTGPVGPLSGLAPAPESGVKCPGPGDPERSGAHPELTGLAPE